MERRVFTLLSGSALAALFLPSLNCSVGPDYEKLTVPPPSELSLIADMKGIEEIGNAYLKLRPEEADSVKLSRLLFSGEIKGRDIPAAQQDELSGLLNRKVRNDFTNGAIIELNGWILSVTEARQCAWLSLNKN